MLPGVVVAAVVAVSMGDMVWSMWFLAPCCCLDTTLVALLWCVSCCTVTLAIDCIRRVLLHVDPVSVCVHTHFAEFRPSLLQDGALPFAPATLGHSLLPARFTAAAAPQRSLSPRWHLSHLRALCVRQFYTHTLQIRCRSLAVSVRLPGFRCMQRFLCRSYSTRRSRSKGSCRRSRGRARGARAGGASRVGGGGIA